ncbi:activating signal cointegrator 1 complex subunit 2 homolog [Episyrphus balteatus]|uniref:activating signal cointegrator 1 complex subunit 2 homolog n=1 Tax=Episyrphus balteatus TaxID=286459 RepID=UPI002485DF96|nr:activating signal cointegrator 1 complex subunit 2 homolog [Episyrphus balteatus]
MNPIVIFSVCLVLTTFSACSGRPAESEQTVGRYIHMVQPYVHVHDNRELGQYVHIPNPYDGGYGPYSGLNNPYRHDESGNYDKYTVSNADFEIPAIRLEYGFPDHDPEGLNKRMACVLSGPSSHNKISTEKPIIKVFEKLTEKPIIVSEKPIIVSEKPSSITVSEKPINDVEKPPVVLDVSNKSVKDIEKPVNDEIKNPIFKDDIENETEKNIEIRHTKCFLFPKFPYTQTTTTTTRKPTTTTTTTVKPRLFNYYEEGGWKILRQEEEKEKHKYDFLYHTENGIYGEEKAKLHPGAGTHATGYYEYTGDDGELYRVNYSSDHNGFKAEGDHIPTPPPVPDAIKRALEYVAKKKETHGAHQSGRYEHKADPIRLQNMPTIDRPLNQQQQQPRSLPPLPTLAPQQPRSLPPLPTLAPLSAQPRFIQYSGSNQYNALPTIAPQNAPQRAYQLPSLNSQRPADQLIQQTQLASQSQPDQLPQVQVLLPQVQDQKPVIVEQVEVARPVQVVDQPAQQVELSSAPVQLPQQEVQQAPLARVEEEQPQSDQPQEDQPQPQLDQPQADQPQQSEPEQQPREEIPIKEEQPADELLQTQQSKESAVIVKPDKIDSTSTIKEVSPESSDQDNTFQPPYQVPEKLTDETDFELTMA